MAIDGSLSNFPTSLNDWGEELRNNQCTLVTAELWNRIQHAVYRLESYAQFPIQFGKETDYVTPSAAATRPVMLVKTHTATVSAPAAEVKHIDMPVFTAAEKALFGGSPLATSGSIHVQARRVASSNDDRRNYVAGVRGPISDFSGDSGWQVSISRLRDQSNNQNHRVTAGTYVITVLIVRTV